MKPIDESREGQSRTSVARWGRFVSRNAKIVLPVVLVVLCLLASPVLAVRLGLADAGTAPEGADHAQGLRPAVRQGFGPGFTSPIPVVVDMRGDHQSAAEDRSSAWSRCPAIAQVDKPIYNAKTPEQASVAIINTYSKYTPQDAEDRRHRLDASATPRSPQTLAGIAGARLRVRPERGLHRHRQPDPQPHAPWFLLYIIGVTFLVLAMAFRSVVIAIKAALTTLLSALVGLRHADADRAARPRHGLHRARPHRPDRELRAADRVRHPVRPVDGLRGVPDEPDPRGARARQRHGHRRQGRHIRASAA